MRGKTKSGAWLFLLVVLALFLGLLVEFLRFERKPQGPIPQHAPFEQHDRSGDGETLPHTTPRLPDTESRNIFRQEPWDDLGVVLTTNLWEAEEAIPFEYVLRFYNAADAEAFAALARKRGARVLGRLDTLHAVRMRVGNVEQLRALLREGPLLLEQGPNFFIRIPPQPPPDSLEPYPGGYVSFGSQAAAWLGIPRDHERWGEGVVVAILDDGVGQHSALASAHIVRLDMLSDAEGSLPTAGTHATAVCSLIAGAGGAVTGVSPAVTVLSLRVVSQNGVGDAFTTAAALVEAVNRGAKVVNICLGGRGDCFVLREAVQYAVDRGVVIVAAAGNDGIEGISYPARYNGVVAVGAVDATGRHLFFSNRGPEIDLVAPGVGVLAAGMNDALVSFSGTSAAVPFVAGALAELLTMEPNLTGFEALRILQEWADDTGAPGKDEMTGYGILNVGRVLWRKTSGICDAALALPFVMPETNHSGVHTVVVYGQNRGTMPLGEVELVAYFDGQKRTRKFSDVAVGSTFALDITVPTGRLLRTGGIPFECLVRVPGGADRVPENDILAGVLMCATP
ncbi:MAG: S8 family peptidase [Kiritimatiellia bacterium]